MSVLLDNTLELAAPEGVTLVLRPAGPAARFAAWTLDFLIRAGVWITLWMVLWFSLGDLGLGLFLIAAFLIEWFYPVSFELYAQGATPGKRALGLMVVHDDGTPVRLSASLVRNLLRAADFLPLLFGFGLLSMMFRRDFKRLGDLAAGTLVVYRPVIHPQRRLPEVPVQAVRAVLRLEEQRALIGFAERSARLSSERLQELAALLPQLGGTNSSAGVECLLGQARKLVGER